MSTADVPEAGRALSVGQVRLELETVLLRVVTAGRVAEVWWRLLLNERRFRQCERAGIDGGQYNAPTPRVWQNAGNSIDATVHEQTPWVYHAAVRAACPADDGDLAVLALCELAGMHLRAGYVDDSRRLVLASAHEQRSERARRVLAGLRTRVDEYEQQHAANDGWVEEGGA